MEKEMVGTKCSRLLSTLCVLMFLLCSCGPQEQSNSAQTKAPETPKYDVYTVEIKDMKFTPDSIVVKKGDKVVFVNRDMVNHCVTEEAKKSWTSGNIPAGESYMLEAQESSSYFCAIHEVMKGKIVVQ